MTLLRDSPEVIYSEARLVWNFFEKPPSVIVSYVYFSSWTLFFFLHHDISSRLLAAYRALGDQWGQAVESANQVQSVRRLGSKHVCRLLSIVLILVYLPGHS